MGYVRDKVKYWGIGYDLEFVLDKFQDLSTGSDLDFCVRRVLGRCFRHGIKAYGGVYGVELGDAPDS